MKLGTRESENQAVKFALTSDYCPPAIQEARDRQDEILIERFKGQPLAIADVGCGTGYHGSIFGPGAKLYHGYEISPEIAEIATTHWREEGLDHARLYLGNVAEATPEPERYDIVFCLYFTPGNFRDPADDLDFYTDEYLDHNPFFIKVFTRFYRALKPGGRMFLTVYKDVPEAEDAQWDFYAHNGWTVLTQPGARFVSTAERFWSARWTRDSLNSNLTACGIDKQDIHLHDLNHIAWLVEVSK